MPQPNHVDQRALCRVQANNEALPDFELARPSSNVSFEKTRTSTGDSSNGIRFPGGIAASIRAGMSPVSPRRASAVVKQRVP